MASYKKIAVISGASSGIGYQLSLKLAQDGFCVCLLARRKKELLNLASKINKQKGQAIPIVCDITKKNQVKQSIEKIVQTFGHINLIICNAGGTIPLETLYSSDLVKQNFDLNVFGLTHMIEFSLPHLKKQGSANKLAQIVYLSSNAAFLPLSYLGVYSATKKASEFLLTALRRELRDENIDISIISPGYIKTPLTARNDFPMPGLLSLERGSKIIYNAIKKKKKKVAFPFFIVLLLRFLACFPDHWVLKLLGNRNIKKSTHPVHPWHL